MLACERDEEIFGKAGGAAYHLQERTSAANL